AEAELTREVDAWLARAAAEDAAEDATHGSTRRGDEPPDWMRDKQARLARIRAAKAELEAEARAAEAARPPPPANPDGSAKPRPGKTPKHEPGKPKPKAQRNFTDPESRIMKGRDGFIQAYNAQAAVDAGAQIIVAHRLTNNGSDQDALLTLLDAIEDNTGEMPNEVSADNGFCSEANLEGLNARTVRGYVAAGRAS
ncbi:transposase, partial [Acidocella aminolytica]